MSKKILNLFAFVLTVITLNYSNANAQAIGIFDGQTDVGKVIPKGAATYNAQTQEYTITSSGANIWGTTDAFHFLWKKLKGDFILRANVQFLPHEGANPHRKV